MQTIPVLFTDHSCCSETINGAELGVKGKHKVLPCLPAHWVVVNAVIYLLALLSSLLTASHSDFQQNIND